jgi:hypothetical protein
MAFAYADWGAMLLRNGDYDDAIEKFALASQKGPTSQTRWGCGARP